MTTVLITDEASVAEIDEALTYARRLPADQRGPGWHAFVDRLLEMRAAKNTGAHTPTFTRPTTGPNTRPTKGAHT